jgi:hypothetical protein
MWHKIEGEQLSSPSQYDTSFPEADETKPIKFGSIMKGRTSRQNLKNNYGFVHRSPLVYKAMRKKALLLQGSATSRDLFGHESHRRGKPVRAK